MAIEIERKFRVLNDTFKRYAIPHRIVQGYICSEKDRVVRVRTYDDKAFITIKNATIGFARDEFEYSIPIEDAQKMLDGICQQPIIEKTRYCLTYENHVWEIDEFLGDNKGLIIAEIELEHREETFNIPPFIGEEVTNDSRFYNARLFKEPYKNWNKK